MTVPFTIPHDADAIANSISKVVNAQSTGTLASNANLANNSVIKSYIDTAVANQLTDLKTSFRPKFARAYQNPNATEQIASGSITSTQNIIYNIDEFQDIGGTDFNYTKITGLIIDAYARSDAGQNYIEAKLPDGTFTQLIRIMALGSGDDVETQHTTFIPIGSGQTTFTLRFYVNRVRLTTLATTIRGFTYLSGLD